MTNPSLLTLWLQQLHVFFPEKNGSLHWHTCSTPLWSLPHTLPLPRGCKHHGTLCTVLKSQEASAGPASRSLLHSPSQQQCPSGWQAVSYCPKHMHVENTMVEARSNPDSLCSPASNLVCQVTSPPCACISLSFSGPRVPALIEAPGTSHCTQKVSAGLPRHKRRVSKNPAPRDSRPPHQSTTEGSSWPGGLAQDAHPQPRSHRHSHRPAHGIVLEQAQVCCVRLSRVMPKAHRSLSPMSSMQRGRLPPGQGRALGLL